MSRTNNPAISVFNSAVTTFTNTNGNLITFNIALSTEASTNLNGYLSGNASVLTPFLSGSLGVTSLSTLSVTPAGISLTWPSIVGNNDFIPFIASSTVVPSASTYTFILDWNALDFAQNTIFYLSANATTIVLSGGNIAQAIDNPFYSRSNTVSDGSNQNNNTFRTVSEHLRRWNLMG